MKNWLLATFIAITGGQALAQNIEITETFVPRFINASLGTTAAVGWVDTEDRCLSDVPVIGGCLSTERVRASGSMRIDSLTAHDGRIFESWDDDPITGERSKGYYSKLYFEFKYTGTAQSEKYLNEILVDRPWGSLHPTGRIQVWLDAGRGTNWSLQYRFVADPGHNDNPNNWLVERLGPKVKARLADYIRSILHEPRLVIR